jgi:hypothetical protein
VKENQENCDSLFFQVVFHQVVLQPFSALQQFASHSATITQIIEKMKIPEIQTMGWKRNTAKPDLGTSPTNNTAKKLCQPLGNLIGDPASHLASNFYLLEYNPHSTHQNLIRKSFQYLPVKMVSFI